MQKKLINFLYLLIKHQIMISGINSKLQQQLTDTIIIGGGITGCYLLNRLLSNKPHKQILNNQILLLEASPRMGGRVETIKFTDTDGIHVQYEAGGARFSDKHKRLIRILKELDLYKFRVPIASDVMHVMLPTSSNQKGLSALFTKYPEIMKIMNHIRKYIKINSVPQTVISMHTLYSFVKDIMNDSALAKYMLGFYEYYSELATLNMSRALDVFVNEFNNRVQYYVLKTGYESIITKLMDGISQNKYCKLNTLVTQIKEVIDATTHIKQFEVITSDLNGNVTIYYTKNLVICIPIDALKKINIQLPGVEKVKDICRKIKPEPLYRIYARFPGHMPITLPKVATNLPIKYIIPIDPKNGIVMLSYTDGIYAKKLNKIYQRDLQDDTDKLTTLLTDNLNTLLPYITEDKELTDLPKPIWIKHHYWASGAGYWLPGNIPDLADVTNPIPECRLYLAGEQVSNHQAWVEGCLETADVVLKQFRANNSTRSKQHLKHLIIYRTKKNNTLRSKDDGSYVGGGKTYTKDEVAKHNTPGDAWMIINKKVYNITKWIDKHPGGNVILQGIGKDATAMFNHKGGGVGHSASAHKILEKYYMGDLI